MYLTVDDIRAQLKDQSPLDNTIDNDLVFSDEDIHHAMGRAAAAYNGTPPLNVDIVSQFYLPRDSTNLFMDAVIWQLHQMHLMRLSRNLLTFTTGGTQINIDKDRLAAYKDIMNMTYQAWREAARDRKRAINLDNSFSML